MIINPIPGGVTMEQVEASAKNVLARNITNIVNGKVFGGFYDGSEKPLAIHYGFRPRVLLVFECNMPDKTAANAAMKGAMFVSGYNENPECLVFDDLGFQVKNASPYYPQVNVPGQRYGFIAMR